MNNPKHWQAAGQAESLLAKLVATGPVVMVADVRHEHAKNKLSHRVGVHAGGIHRNLRSALSHDTWHSALHVRHRHCARSAQICTSDLQISSTVSALSVLEWAAVEWAGKRKTCGKNIHLPVPDDCHRVEAAISKMPSAAHRRAKKRFWAIVWQNVARFRLYRHRPFHKTVKTTY